MHHISQKMKIEMRVLCYYFFSTTDRCLLFSSIISLVVFFSWSFLFALAFPSPLVPLGVMLDSKTYVDTHASACSTRLFV